MVKSLHSGTGVTCGDVIKLDHTVNGYNHFLIIARNEAYYLDNNFEVVRQYEYSVEELIEDPNVIFNIFKPDNFIEYRHVKTKEPEKKRKSIEFDFSNSNKVIKLSKDFFSQEHIKEELLKETSHESIKLETSEALLKMYEEELTEAEEAFSQMVREHAKKILHITEKIDLQKSYIDKLKENERRK